MNSGRSSYSFIVNSVLMALIERETKVNHIQQSSKGAFKTEVRATEKKTLYRTAHVSLINCFTYLTPGK